jgi:hypothetical protein
VGGVRVPTEVIEAMIKSADRRAIFASSVASSIREADLNGIEINFSLDAKGGSKYSKGSLVALAKVRAFQTSLCFTSDIVQQELYSTRIYGVVEENSKRWH